MPKTRRSCAVSGRKVTTFIGHLRRGYDNCDAMAGNLSPNGTRQDGGQFLRINAKRLFCCIGVPPRRIRNDGLPPAPRLPRRNCSPVVPPMTRARGQSSRTLLDREFPYQVVVQAESVGGDMPDSVVVFHATPGLPTKKRSVRRDDRLWLLYCFAQRADADAFRYLFGGQVFKRMPPD